MAMGDIIMSAVSAGSPSFPCGGCNCHGYWTDTISLTVSGIISCGCVGDRKIINIVMPGAWSLAWDAGTTSWISAIAGSNDLYISNVPGSGLCDVLVTPAQFQFRAICVNGYSGADPSLLVTGQTTTSDGVFSAIFTAHGTQSNSQTCASGLYAVGDGQGTV
jgi:hypothetical protein